MKFDFKRKILKNGMIVLFEKRDIPVGKCCHLLLKMEGLMKTIEEKRNLSFY